MKENVVKVLQRSQLSQSQSDVKPFIYMHSKWLEDATELHLFLTTSNSCYKATLKHDKIQSAAEELEQPYNEFFAECEKALTTQMGLPGFDYELDEQQAQFKLWKHTGFETLYVEISVRKVSNVYQLLDAAIECGQRQSVAANELAAEYKQYIRASLIKENKLLKKVLLVLNSKKENDDADDDVEDVQSENDDADDDVEDVQPENDDTDDDGYFEGATQVLTQKDAMQE